MQKILILLTSLILSVGCAHKIEVQQGNLVTEDKIAQLSPGMNEQQVRFLLGSPLLQDPFHQERWDYYFSLNAKGQLQAQHRLTLYFKSGVLVRFEKQGAIPATEAEAIAQRAAD